MHRTLEVALHGIVCIDTGDDEDNDELEIRGTQQVQVIDRNGNVRDNHEMWHKGNNDGVSIKQGEHNVHIIRNFQTVAVREGETLRFGGHIAEEDRFNADDFMGNNFKDLDFSDLGNLHPDGVHFPIFFSESTQQVRVDYTVQEIH